MLGLPADLSAPLSVFRSPEIAPYERFFYCSPGPFPGQVRITPFDTLGPLKDSICVRFCTTFYSEVRKLTRFSSDDRLANELRATPVACSKFNSYASAAV